MTSVTAATVTPGVANRFTDQAKEIYLAKVGRNICNAVCLVAMATLGYQIYENPSILNPFSRSVNPWSDNSAWFSNDHITCIIMGLSQIAVEAFDVLIRQKEARQA